MSADKCLHPYSMEAVALPWRKPSPGERYCFGCQEHFVPPSDVTEVAE